MAARALGYIGDERAVPSLIEAMGSEDFSLRRIAIDALSGIGMLSIPLLPEALRHRERGARSRSAECFRQMDHIPETEREKIYLFMANEDWLELTKRGGENAIEMTDSSVNYGNDENRVGAVTAQGKIGGIRAIGIRTRIHADNNAYIRRNAIGSLAKMGWTPTVALLQKLRDTTGSTVLQQAIDQVRERIARKNESRQGS